MTKKAEEWQGLIRGVYSRAGPVADSDLQISSSEWGGGVSVAKKNYFGPSGLSLF